MSATGAEVVLADWDFGPSSTLRVVANRAGDGFAGRTTNFPLRPALGVRGAADELDPRLAPEAYDAIHFHDDDLDDAGWEDDVVLRLDADLPSGVYGIRVRASDGTEDTVPFVMTPGAERNKILLVLPTLSYLAYSCEHVMADPGARDYLKAVGISSPPFFGGNKHDEYLLANGLRSLYDVHTDLSGVCYTSTQKPLPNIRHDHRWAAVAGGPTSAHQFSADLRPPPAGEWHHSTTGELGGLWRLRGRSPQALLGIGMVSQGFDLNRPYDVVADPADPRVAFAFEGIDLSSGKVGDFESMVNGWGAAGVEVDRVDAAWGTPEDTVVLATATGFSRAYGLDPVEVALPDGRYDGETSDKIRCDLVVLPKPNGGAVFSTGSIAWCGSLLVNKGDNAVSQLTRNVLRTFAEVDELPFAGDRRR